MKIFYSAESQKHTDFFRSSLPETEMEPVPEALWFYTDTVAVVKSLNNV